MELDLTSRLRRGREVTRPQTRTEAAPSQRKSAGGGGASKSDRLTLSRQAVKILEEQNRRFEEELRARREARMAEYSERTESDDTTADEASVDQLEKSLKVMDKCQKIAARIMRGDKVPPEDEQYLMNNDPEGYKLTLALRKPKKHPKEWESVLDDEDKKAESSGENGEGSGPEEVSAAEGSGGSDQAAE